MPRKRELPEREYTEELLRLIEDFKEKYEQEHRMPTIFSLYQRLNNYGVNCVEIPTNCIQICSKNCFPR